MGNCGGVPSPEPMLLGGLLKGETSWDISPFRGVGGAGAMVDLGAGIKALSFRGADIRGAVLTSRLNSPERRGGGGEGGREPPMRGAFPRLSDADGLCGWLGILKEREDPVGVDGLAIASGFRYGDWSVASRLVSRPFGGERGGWTVTAGGG